MSLSTLTRHHPPAVDCPPALVDQPATPAEAGPATVDLLLEPEADGRVPVWVAGSFDACGVQASATLLHLALPLQPQAHRPAERPPRHDSDADAAADIGAVPRAAAAWLVAACRLLLLAAGLAGAYHAGQWVLGAPTGPAVGLLRAPTTPGAAR
jgi:hypothetical protein